MSTLASVFGYGLLSARAAASVAGRFYYATDTSLMYRDNGSTWDTLGLAGAGTGTVTTVKDEGSNLSTAVVSLDFVGTGVTATGTTAVTVTIPGLNHSTLGYTTIGGSTEAMTQYNHYVKQITLAAAGFLASVSIYIAGNASGAVEGLRAGVWTDVTGAPSAVRAISGGGGAAVPGGLFPEITSGVNPPAGWITMPVGVWLAAGTYWIGFMQEAAGFYNIYYDGSGSDRKWTAGGAYLTGATTRYTITTTSNKYSIYADILS